MVTPLRCRCVVRAMLCAVNVLLPALEMEAQVDTTSPVSPVRLVFVHHSVGWAWLNPDEGNLLGTLRARRYYVSDTDYDWGPPDTDVNDGANVGSHTDIGHWYNWFLGPHRDTYLASLYTNTALSADWRDSESVADPGGENTVIVFKSCFVSAQTIYGDENDAPLAAGLANPLRGRGTAEEDGTMYTVENIKGLYRDLLEYFRTRPDKLFVIVTTPPSFEGAADEAMPKLRKINAWLVEYLLTTYQRTNVAVFDYSAVLTSNGGNSSTNDLHSVSGSHHRFINGRIEYRLGPSPYLAYPSWDASAGAWDNHPSPAGHQKAAAEFAPILNAAYNRWKRGTEATSAPRPDRTTVLDAYPDPADGYVHIRITGPDTPILLSIHDALGRRMQQPRDIDMGAGSVHRLDTGTFPPGLYHIVATTARGSTSRALRVIHR